MAAASEQYGVSREKVVGAANGWAVLLVLLVLMAAEVVWLVIAHGDGLPVLLSVVAFVLEAFALNGLFTLQPNEARVLVLFGAYHGTVRRSGFWWANPLYAGSGLNGLQQMAALGTGAGGNARLRGQQPSSGTRTRGRNKVSMRARTLNGDPLKVNDKRGNPIEIAAVVVWRVEDTAQALFDVDDYENYVAVQSETALRHIANLYSYDDGEGGETTLRTNVDEVSEALRKELCERLGKAGVVVDEARLSHLAYAPEIAQVMLRRQQADAVIAARARIVEGAVGMVEMALNELAAKGVVTLEDERRASMVSNLMVVLCSESEVHPVVNTGTLYS